MLSDEASAAAEADDGDRAALEDSLADAADNDFLAVIPIAPFSDLAGGSWPVLDARTVPPEAKRGPPGFLAGHHHDPGRMSVRQDDAPVGPLGDALAKERKVPGRGLFVVVREPRGSVARVGMK